MSEHPAKILIVDDDRIILDSISEMLRLDGHSVRRAASLREARQALEGFAADLIVADVNMPNGGGFELLSVVRQAAPDTVVIMMTAYGTIESAVEAIKLGAYDYLTKPIDDEEFLLAIQRGLAQRTLLRENRSLKQQLDQRYGLDSLIGQDAAMARVFETIEAVAYASSTVLIQGPSGTGKSLAARVIHRLGPRRDRPFVEVAAGALPDTLLESELFGHVRGAFTGALADRAGKFEAADGGTIFLDEIGTASPAMQVKLLRVLQERAFEPVGGTATRKVDVRVIVATNQDLEQAVRAGTFREDLFYRVSVVTLDLPPLSRRIGDIPLLARRFLAGFAQAHQRPAREFSTEAMTCLQGYAWPGNVRELANVVERCVVLCRGRLIDTAHLPQKLTLGGDPSPAALLPDRISSLKDALEATEKRIVEAVLNANQWNRQLAAVQLDINRTTLYKKMKRHGLDRKPG
ncbi:MAG: sigma-54-dependent Fis family transcriptional regulator [Phycisphaerales bacterium]|nr:MAG: sigma-54-dependent Fis family transcriptional regulator [Phycisphaerales bacterium]